MTGRAPLFVNQRARLHADAVRAALAESAHLVELRETSPDELERVVAEAVAAGAPVVAVAGGDGSQRTAAQEIAGSESALLPFPTGTLNHFAIRCGIESLDDAAGLLRDAGMMSRSVGVLDDCLFLNTAIVGAYPAIVRRRDRLRRVMPKWPAALAAFGAAGLRRMRRNPVRIEIDDRVIERRTDLIWIGVGRGSYPLPTAAAGGDVLEIAVLRELPRRALVRFLVDMLRHAIWPRQPRPAEHVELFHGRRVVIRSPKRLDATLDGEPCRFGSPIFVAIQQNALRVVARA